MESRTRELDLRHYREPGAKLPKGFTFRFRRQADHTMYYANNVDLLTLRYLGALTGLYRTTYFNDRTEYDGDVYYTRQHQYMVEFSLPAETPLVLGKVSTLPEGVSNAVNFA